MASLVTIKDIARALNISVATVSRALRDTYDVSQETKDKVLRVAKELNYQPNINASSLANGKTNNIGIILPFVTNYYFSTVITGIQEVAYSKGYNIMLFITNDDPEREEAITRNLNISSFAGFLVSSCSSSFDHFNEVTEKGLHVVFFDRVSPTMDTSKVKQDDYNGAFMATEHLITQGYKNIAHLAGPRGIEMTEKRLKGYVDALHKHELPLRHDYIIHSGFSQECGSADMEVLLSCDERPDAIFGVNDRKAIGAMLTLKQHHIQIGKEIGVIGFTNDPAAALITPTLTTVAEPAFDIGRISCELLLRHISKKRFPPEEVVLPTTLIIRESTQRN